MSSSPLQVHGEHFTAAASSSKLLSTHACLGLAVSESVLVCMQVCSACDVSASVLTDKCSSYADVCLSLFAYINNKLNWYYRGDTELHDSLSQPISLGLLRFALFFSEQIKCKKKYSIYFFFHNFYQKSIKITPLYLYV